MKTHVLAFIIAIAAPAAGAQTIVVINDPAKPPVTAKLDAANKRIIDKTVLPRVRKKLAGDACKEDFRASGVVNGSFTKPGAKQTLVLYQFCETGNGLGNVGLVLLEGGKAVGSFVNDAGWANDITVIPDIDQNGLDEFAVYYSGGLHQGSGGLGVDILEFSGDAIRGLGWFQADSFGPDQGDFAYKVTAQKGTKPVFYREKYATADHRKPRKTGRNLKFTLEEIAGKFERVN
jgi:hypothetical protein